MFEIASHKRIRELDESNLFQITERKSSDLYVDVNKISLYNSIFNNIFITNTPAANKVEPEKVKKKWKMPDTEAKLASFQVDFDRIKNYMKSIEELKTVPKLQKKVYIYKSNDVSLFTKMTDANRINIDNQLSINSAILDENKYAIIQKYIQENIEQIRATNKKLIQQRDEYNAQLVQQRNEYNNCKEYKLQQQMLESHKKLVELLKRYNELIEFNDNDFDFVKSNGFQNIINEIYSNDILYLEHSTNIIKLLHQNKIYNDFIEKKNSLQEASSILIHSIKTVNS